MNSFLLLSLFLTYASGIPHANNGGRIVGGHDISIEEAPYQISLQVDGSHDCGGSIISQTLIITAAHCTKGVNPDRLSVRAGSSIRDVGGQVVNVSVIHNHPNYNSASVDNDIAVLELESPLTFGKAVAAIGLPSEHQSWPAGTEVLVSGWGLMHERDMELATNLQGVTVEIIDTASCEAAYGENSITNHMLCAGVSGGGKDACISDSGGPLAVNGVLGGVVSFGNGCGQARYPGVYANVPNLRGFIKEGTGL